MHARQRCDAAAADDDDEVVVAAAAAVQENAEVVGITAHPSRKYFVSASADGSWSFYDAGTASLLRQVRTRARPSCVPPAPGARACTSLLRPSCARCAHVCVRLRVLPAYMPASAYACLLVACMYVCLYDCMTVCTYDCMYV